MSASIPMTAFALAASIATVGGAGAGPVLAHGSRSHRPHHSLVKRAVRLDVKPLVFGIYPGGAVGTVGQSGTVKPEDPAKRLAALQQLRPANVPFLVRLYAAYHGPDQPSAAQQVGGDVADYTRGGFDVELVITYRPQSGGASADVAAFAQFASDSVQTLGADRGVISLQVTNEANVGGSPNCADGYYAGAQDALIAGVLAAKQEIRRRGFTQLKVGFNWTYVTGLSDRKFWSYLGSHGGRPFGAALDWVGFDVYPGTWGPSLGGGGLQTGTTRFIDDALAQLRANLIVAGIDSHVPLHASESGYPTGPGRTEAMQSKSIEASIMALDSARPAYNVTNYTWFDLRDADSSTQDFETQYGLMRDDYSPKPAFAVYKALIARLSSRVTRGLRARAGARGRRTEPVDQALEVGGRVVDRDRRAGGGAYAVENVSSESPRRTTTGPYSAPHRSGWLLRRR